MIAAPDDRPAPDMRRPLFALQLESLLVHTSDTRDFDKLAIPFYPGSSLVRGRMRNNDNSYASGQVNAANVPLGFDTPMGPLSFGYGFNDAAKPAVYLILGRNFRGACVAGASPPRNGSLPRPTPRPPAIANGIRSIDQAWHQRLWIPAFARTTGA